MHAEWKAAYEENERSSYPYERSTAVEALLELKALVSFQQNLNTSCPFGSHSLKLPPIFHE